MPSDFTESVNREAITPSVSRRRPIYASLGKRLFDVAFVLATAPITVPVILLFAVAIRLGGGGPAFFVQDRVGRHGRIFRLFKLRTMVEDAETALERYFDANPQARVEWECHQKLRHDPRVTWVGRFLRATSLDELPQVLNILIGDMSLVGPRPMTPNQIELYPGNAYYEILPGLTGPWQVGDRNETSFAGRAAYDAAYAQDLSLTSDIRLILCTFQVVLRRTGI